MNKDKKINARAILFSAYTGGLEEVVTSSLEDKLKETLSLSFSSSSVEEDDYIPMFFGIFISVAIMIANLV